MTLLLPCINSQTSRTQFLHLIYDRVEIQNKLILICVLGYQFTSVGDKDCLSFSSSRRDDVNHNQIKIGNIDTL